MKTRTLRIRTGYSAYWAIAEATRIAKSQHCLVKFRFNDMRFVAAPKKSAWSLLWDLTHSITRSQAHYGLTAEARVEEKRLEGHVRHCQIEIDGFMTRLDEAIVQGQDSVIGWLKDFLPLADYIMVKYDRGLILEKLRAAGYVTNACCNLTAEDYKTKAAAGKWLIGQVMNCYEQGAPVPVDQTRSHFINYFKLSEGP